MSADSLVVVRRITDLAADRFLELVATYGNSSAAARLLGTTRNSWYAKAATDESFRLRWDAALLQSRQNIAQDILEKAVVASGRIVEEPLLDDAGNVVLDEDLEAVMVRRLVDADSRILAKMVDKFLESADGPPTNNIQINNVAPQVPRQRRLVVSAPEEAQPPMLTTETAGHVPIGPRPAIEADFEIVRGN